MSNIRTALISLSDKTGIVDFVKELASFKVQIISTGGTAKALRNASFNVLEVSDYTGFPEIMDGRVKTLHPKVHGGILALRDNIAHMQTAAQHAITLIDMIVVNLYPFEKTIAKPDTSFDEAIENIDIGGPTMLRAAAKNFRDVVVIVDPSDYMKVLQNMQKNKGAVDLDVKAYLAQKVFKITSDYDSMIANYLLSQQATH